MPRLLVLVHLEQKDSQFEEKRSITPECTNSRFELEHYGKTVDKSIIAVMKFEKTYHVRYIFLEVNIVQLFVSFIPTLYFDVTEELLRPKPQCSRLKVDANLSLRHEYFSSRGSNE